MYPVHRACLERAALNAPTADNSKPWKFHWGDQALDLRLRNVKDRPISDTTFLLTDLGAGACVENVSLCAARLGYRIRVTPVPAPDNDPGLVARIHWESDEPAESELAEAIPTRHTDRGFPWRPMAVEDAAWLQSLGRGDARASMPFIEGKHRRHTAHRALRNAEAARFSDRSLHAELFQSIDFRVGWRRATTTGLAPGALAIEPPLRPVFKLLRYWPIMRAVNAIGGSDIMAMRSAVLPAMTASHLCLLQANTTDRRDILQSGRVLQRVWLGASARGIAVQPFAAAGVIAHAGIHLSARNRARRDAVVGCMSELAEFDKQGLMFVRLGVSRKRPTVQSGH